MMFSFARSAWVFVKGLFIGAANIVPGVSGGTIAVILGIYEQILDALGGIVRFDTEWRKRAIFLILLGVGIACSLFSLSVPIGFLLDRYPFPMAALFVGFIAGGVPALYRSLVEKGGRKIHVAGIVAGIIAIAGLERLLPTNGGNADSAAIILFSGFMSGGAMVLPGISGSLILLIMGSYRVIVAAIGNFDVSILAIFGVGALAGIPITALLARYLLNRYGAMSMAVITGMVAASPLRVIPSDGLPQSTLTLAAAIAVGAVGVAAAWFIGRGRSGWSSPDKRLSE